MSFAKELLFGDDPRFDEERERLRKQNATTIDQFSVRLRGKRKGVDGRWSAEWHSSVVEAAEELGIKFKCVNSHFAFKTQSDQTAVAGRAETVWQEKVAEHRKWLDQSKR